MANILSDIGSTLRPVAKELIKGGIYLWDTVSEAAFGTGEKLKAIVAEAKTDLAQQNGKPPEEATKAVLEKDEGETRPRRKTRVRVRRSR